MVTRAAGNSFWTAMAITWLMEWRILRSSALSLVLGRAIGAGSGLVTGADTDQQGRA
jgi:hypothetical protein